MAKVIATSKGYWGGIIREVGAAFSMPDDEAKITPWVAASGSAVGNAEGVKPEEIRKPVTVPADWQSMSAADRRDLAKDIAGRNVPNAKEADEIISAYAEESNPAPFADAPEPQTIAEAQKENGGIAPDWIAPGAPKPVND